MQPDPPPSSWSTVKAGVASSSVSMAVQLHSCPSGWITGMNTASVTLLIAPTLSEYSPDHNYREQEGKRPLGQADGWMDDTSVFLSFPFGPFSQGPAGKRTFAGQC